MSLLSTGDSPTGGGNTTVLATIPSLAVLLRFFSAKVIPRQGVETLGEPEDGPRDTSAQVIPRQGVETKRLNRYNHKDYNLSTGDSPTGGGN